MVFASSLFLFLFLPITLAGYFVIGKRFRNLFLLVMSLLFYAWGEPVYVFLMLGSILLNYGAGVLIEQGRQQRFVLLNERSILILCVSINLALLFYFKYANFFIGNLNWLLSNLNLTPISAPQIVLPIGISFFTFQAMSYVIDVYRKETAVQWNPLDCALYVTFFPQLIAGPIVRYHDVAQQIVMRTTSRRQFSSGIQRFIFGLSKKVLLANSLGQAADQIFALPAHEITVGTAWLGIVCYTLQIYFDFAGYSDMAIGLGRMFGFEFLENFDFPYISQSIQEFWRRWHISLSTWFRDYLYIPLGGNRLSPLRTYVNLWIVFLLCGIWHGASWNFIVWGALHGIYLVVERLGWHRYLTRLWRPLRHAYTLLLVMIAWVFFRTESLGGALHYLGSMVGVVQTQNLAHDAFFYTDPKTIITLLMACIFATPLAIRIRGWLQALFTDARLQRWQWVGEAGYYGLLMLLFVFSAAYLAAGTYNPFIYYRF